jgi:hypothetical protein
MTHGRDTGNDPREPQPDVIRNLGRTICFGVLIPWLVSGVMHFRPWFFFACLVASVIPRLVFRKRRAPAVVEWASRDWAWTALAVVITTAYLSGLTPAGLTTLIGS